MIKLQSLFALALMLLISVFELTAQEKGTVRFFIDPGHNYEYVLDGKKRLQEKNLELTVGEHKFSFWAPTRSIVDTTINVVAGAQSFYLRLPHSLQYMAHERHMEKFKRDVFWKRSAPALVSVGMLAWTVGSYAGYRKSWNELDDLRNSYSIETVPNNIRTLKEVSIPEAKQTFSDKRTGLYISSGSLAVSLLATAYLWKKTGSLSAPVFDDKAKVEFDGLVYMPDGNGGGQLHAGLKLKW